MLPFSPLESSEGTCAWALYRAAGFTDRHFASPLVGVIKSYSSATPGHAHLRKVAHLACGSLDAAGARAVEFNVPTPCDSLAQGDSKHYVLPMRDVIAAGAKLVLKAHGCRTAVMICSCDKIIPGLLMPIFPFADTEEALRLANDTIYGLASYMFPRDLNRALEVTEELEFGIVGLNDMVPVTAEAPFGGINQSRQGREGGAEGLEEYLETKYVSVGLG